MMTTYTPAPPLAQQSLAASARYETRRLGFQLISKVTFRRSEQPSLADGYAELAQDEEFTDSRRDARARSAARPPRSALDD